MNIDELSHSDRTILLARIAHELTVSARSTYEPGTEKIVEPEVLRGYNELMHRVTASLNYHMRGENKFSLEAILKMLDEFAARFNKAAEIRWVLKTVQERPLPTSH